MKIIQFESLEAKVEARSPTSAEVTISGREPQIYPLHQLDYMSYSEDNPDLWGLIQDAAHEECSALEEKLLLQEAWNQASPLLRSIATRLRKSKYAGLLSDVLATPSGGWGNAPEAWDRFYDQFVDSFPDLVNLSNENLALVGLMLGYNLHPTRK